MLRWTGPGVVGSGNHRRVRGLYGAGLLKMTGAPQVQDTRAVLERFASGRLGLGQLTVAKIHKNKCDQTQWPITDTVPCLLPARGSTP